jgi:hypothetical protein
MQGLPIPAHGVVAEALALLEKVLVLLDTHRPAGLGDVDVRRLGQVAHALERAHCAGAADGDNNGVHLRAMAPF